MRKISLNGYIGWDITPQLVAEELAAANGDDIEITLYSGGGDVFDGFEIYNLLNAYEGKITIILGSLVASAATYAPLAADKVIAQDITNFMIHDVTAWTEGSSEELKKESERIERHQNLIASKYAEVMNKTVDEVLDLMHAETWFTGQEIVDAGFADELVKTGKANNNSLEFYKRQVKNCLNKKEKDVLTKSEILKELKNSKKEINFNDVVNIFEASNLVKTDDEVKKLNEYSNLENKLSELENALITKDATIAAKDKEITNLKMGQELDVIFGAKSDDNLPRIRAEELYLAGKDVENIKKDVIMINLMAQKAAGNQLIIDGKKTEDGEFPEGWL